LHVFSKYIVIIIILLYKGPLMSARSLLEPFNYFCKDTNKRMGGF